MEWHCPSWGCRGLIALDTEPKHGQIAWCRAPSDTDVERRCGRPMEWHDDRGAWLPLPR